MKVTISEILMYRECPRRWAFRHVSERVPIKKRQDARDLGSLFHGAMDQAAQRWVSNADRENLGSESFWKTSLQLGLELAAAELQTELRPQDKTAVASLAYAAAAFWAHEDREGEEILAIEKPLGVALSPGIDLLTIPDLVYVRDGRLWHRQYKTLAKRADASDLIRAQKRSLHEGGYRHTIQETWPEYEYAGTDLVIFPKDPMHLRAKGEECYHCKRKGLQLKSEVIGRPYIQMQLNVSANLQHLAMYEIKRTADEIYQDQLKLLADKDKGGLPDTMLRHHHACYSPRFGLCGYIDACDGETSIFNPGAYQYEDPMRRYERRQDEAEENGREESPGPDE